MDYVRRRVGLVATAGIVTALVFQCAAPAAAAKPPAAPTFVGPSTLNAKVNKPFAFSIKTKANPTASIALVGTLPLGVSFHDNGNGIATVSGTEPLGGSYAFGLHATNVVGSGNKSFTLIVKSKLPLIRHVFVIALENEGYAKTFGTPANDPYLATTLPSHGALLQNYFATGHASNSNYVALVSGQPPNTDNQLDCIVSGYADFPSNAGQTAQGLQNGNGCVYPSAVQTLAGQLNGEGLTWKGYEGDMGNDPVRDGGVTCAHPPVGNSDGTVLASSTDGYAMRHNPFVYFHSIIDNASLCGTSDVPLGTTTGAMPPGTPVGITGLATDLQSTATTPNYSFITPNVCDDGHDSPPCHNQPSGATALADVDAFLQTWVPRITSSPAFQQDGLLEITFDEADVSDATACCGETPGPTNVQPGLSGPGGGRVGTVLISPFITPGKVVKTDLNHYSNLASVEDLFGLPRLGDARTVTTTFDKGIYDK